MAYRHRCWQMHLSFFDWQWTTCNLLFQQYVPLLASPDISWHIYIFDMRMHILGETIEQMQEWLSRRPIDISGDHLPCLLAVTRFLNKEWDNLDSKGRSLHRLHTVSLYNPKSRRNYLHKQHPPHLWPFLWLCVWCALEGWPILAGHLGPQRSLYHCLCLISAVKTSTYTEVT